MFLYWPPNIDKNKNLLTFTCNYIFNYKFWDVKMNKNYIWVYVLFTNKKKTTLN